VHHKITHHKQPRNEAGNRRAFTLMELMVTLSIIVLLLGFLGSALGRATRSARQTASQRSAEAIAASVEQFRLEFGFLPPLVHDGEVISDGNYRPWDQTAGTISTDEGPLKPGLADVVYPYQTLVVWSEGFDFNFFRRRTGDSADSIEIPAGGSWDLDTAWDDRRYTRYGLAYYLMGVLPRSVDGIAGQGMSRPLASGGFVNVGYPIGGTRDNFEPTLDVDRGGISLQTGYVRPLDLAEHGVVPFSDTLSVDDVYSLYDAEELDQLTALVDSFGTAFRYYRWEHGRYNAQRQLVIETSLDLNIPPVLLDPEVLITLMNDDMADPMLDVTAGNPELRQARFAIVGAGADKLFGTEPIEYIVQQLNTRDPGGDPGEIARIRKLAMDDNVVAYGK
jgi:prepilin-type N-terminal cleavage/methylation domain-containing protein